MRRCFLSECYLCLKRVIKLINFVKTSAVNTRLFKRLCEDYGSKSTCLLYYTEVHWLSRSNATRRFFELRDKLLQFFKEKNHNFQADLECREFVARLAYLSDIFEVLDNFDMSFQGSNETLSEYISKLEAFVCKLVLWIENVKNKSRQCSNSSPRLRTNLMIKFSEEIVCHFSQLKKELMHYFPDHTSCAYSINPFFVNLTDLPVGTGEQVELIEIQTDEAAKIKLKKCSCPINFWLSMKSLYPNLDTHAVLIFSPTWECEQGFSAFNEHKIENPKPPCCPWA